MTDDYKVKYNFVDAIQGESDLKHYKSDAAMVACDPPLLCGNAIGIMIVPKKYQREPLNPAFCEEA